MNLFLRLFNAGIPWPVIISTLLLSACVHTYLYYKGNKHGLLSWIIACLFLMLYSTVIGRIIDGSWETGNESGVHLIPFWSIGAIQDGYIETLYEKTYNIIFFVPYGVLLKAYPQPLPKGKGVRWKISILIGFLTSIMIELLQLVTRTGTCETDDVICNTIGCAIGAVMTIGISGIRELWNEGMREKKWDSGMRE